MEAGDKVKIRMLRVLNPDVVMDEADYECVILRYDPREERIYLLLKGAALQKISLDAVYSCMILRKNETEKLTGRMKERYISEVGEVLELQIENGVYGEQEWDEGRFVEVDESEGKAE